jgi:hypothetical protein
VYILYYVTGYIRDVSDAFFLLWQYKGHMHIYII